MLLYLLMFDWRIALHVSEIRLLKQSYKTWISLGVWVLDVKIRPWIYSSRNGFKIFRLVLRYFKAIHWYFYLILLRRRMRVIGFLLMFSWSIWKLDQGNADADDWFSVTIQALPFTLIFVFHRIVSQSLKSQWRRESECHDL